MIYILERPHQRKSFCWTAKDRNDFSTKVARENERCGDTIYEAQTIREMERECGFNPELAEDLAEYGLTELAATHGIDKTLYKGYLDDAWSSEPIDQFEQYVKACGQDLYDIHVYETEAAAVEALRSGELDSGHNTSEGRTELIERLVKEGDQTDALVAIGLKDTLIAWQLLADED